MDIWAILERAAARWPERVGVVDGEARHTWQRTHERAADLACTLREGGVGAGDRVAFLGLNSHAFLEAYFAAGGLGAILVPLNTRLAGAELRAILADAEPAALMVDRSLEDLAAAAGWDGVRVSVPRADPGRAQLEPAEVAPDDPAQLYYTSGTTGRPKGVVLTHANVVEHALAATSELDLGDDDVWAHVAPMFHLADAWATFALTWVGGAHVMEPRFEERTTLELLSREGVTVTNLVPTMLIRLVRAARESRPPEHRLRLLLSGGAPISAEVVRDVLAVFGCEYVQTYGMTETSPFLTLGLLQPHHRDLPPEAQLAKRTRTGRPFETVTLEVVDDEGRPVARDGRAVGEIRVQGATVSPGYWRRPEETSAAFRGGWLYTGDLATIDDEGYVDIVDRRKDLILTGGENVYSIEVEDVLGAHEAVLEAAVFGVPHPEWGEEVRAAVVLTSDVSAEALTEHCRARLAGFKCPRSIEIRAELPRTGSGKISKATLRSEARA